MILVYYYGSVTTDLKEGGPNYERTNEELLQHSGDEKADGGAVGANQH